MQGLDCPLSLFRNCSLPSVESINERDKGLVVRGERHHEETDCQVQRGHCCREIIERIVIISYSLGVSAAVNGNNHPYPRKQALNNVHFYEVVGANEY